MLAKKFHKEMLTKIEWTMNAIRRQLSALSQFRICLAILLTTTVIRLIGLRYSIVDLFVDEAQYWDWSRDFAFGYFSNPPILAWIIAGANVICGSGEACVRAPSPIIYLGTALCGYAVSRELYDERTAFWTALVIILAPGIVFSSRIISTDVPLLFFWALALLAYVKLLRGGDIRWAFMLGIAFGFGLLAKYAMAYFLLCVAACHHHRCRCASRTARQKTVVRARCRHSLGSAERHMECVT
jgi:4-amino-4-deoxy-L-arabinose transferase-like glycosyltransferase